MNNTDKKILDMDLADTIVDRPQGFTVGSRHFYLYPVTLGKMFLLSRLVDELEINEKTIRVNPYLEAIRCAKEKKDICCRILTYHTIRTKAKAFDNEFIDKRTKFFAKELDTEDLATVMVMVLTWNKTPLLTKHLGIDKEQRRMEKAMKVKDGKNTITFGCQSIYGSLIDNACERYGWTFDYVVWEISYMNLKLMLADSSKQVYLTDDELKKAGIHTGKAKKINGDDAKAVREYIKSLK